MEFFDVLFPINLNPLTYRCPDTLSDTVEPGMIVSAPLKNRTAKGVIVGKSLMIPHGNVRDIQKVYGDAPVLSNNMINLLRWMSEYYLSEQGFVLKNMLPKEAFKKVKQRKTLTRGVTKGLKGAEEDHPLNIINVNNNIVSATIDSIHKNAYRTFLLHAPSSVYEYSFLIKMLSGIENVILLVPEIAFIKNLLPLLKERFGERVCLFHSGLSSGKRSEAIERILSCCSDMVLGTRSAVFAPLKKVSFIVVLHEHSCSYKQEGGLCYSGRDIAVKRGYFERATVLLSSVCPSIESLYNCRTGKYTLLKPSDDVKKPGIRIVDMRYEKLLKPYLSKTVIDASARYIKNDKKVMFVINRRGYSTLLQCMDCNYVEGCPYCGIPLVLHKTDTANGHGLRVLKCHYCGYITRVPDSCGRCKGYNMRLLGAGTQRVQEDIEGLIGTKTLRIDSDRTRKKSEIEDLIGASLRGDFKIIVGTKLMTRRLGPESGSGSRGFSMAAVLKTDLFLNLPDFRSAEKAYQEILFIVDKIEPHGEIFIQTRMPQNYLFKYLKNYDYSSFVKEELHRRRVLMYPPYSRLLLIKFISKRDIFVELTEIIKKTKKIIPAHPPSIPPLPRGDTGGLKREGGNNKMKRMDDKVEIIGPDVKKNISGKYELKLLLKSPVRGELHSVARTFLEAFKDLKDVKIRIDVDPISI